MSKRAWVLAPLVALTVAAPAQAAGWRLFGVTGKQNSGLSRGDGDEQMHVLNTTTGESEYYWGLPDFYARDSVTLGYSPETNKLYFHSGSNTYGSKPVADYYYEEIDLHTRATNLIYDNNGVSGTVIPTPWAGSVDGFFAARSLTWENGDFWVGSKETGAHTLSETGDATFIGPFVAGGAKAIGFATINGNRRFFQTTNADGSSGSDLWMLDPTDAFPLDDSVSVQADNEVAIDGILGWAEHPDTGEIWAIVQQGGADDRFLATLDIVVNDGGGTPDLVSASAHIIAPLNDHYAAIAWAPDIVPGDANDDGAVTGADFTIWADNFGAISGPPTATNPKPLGESIGDFNVDGTVSGADFTIWADNFGSTSDVAGGAGTANAVPEPSSFLLALASLVAVVLGIHRARR